ncbi:hypothetical protein [Synechococcus sp. MIT S9509]
MTRSTGQRESKARLLQLGKYVRGKHPARYGLSLRRKKQPDGSEPIWVTFNTQEDRQGTQKWVRLDGVDWHSNDAEISEAVDLALIKFDQKSEKKAATVGSSLGIYKRAAIKKIEESGNTVKHAERRRRWLNTLCTWLDENDRKATEREHLLEWIRTWPADQRSRRDAISAACLLFNAATKGRPLNPGSEVAYEPPAPGQGKPVDPDEILRVILYLWELSEGDDPADLAHCAAWLTSWVALTGARGAMVMGSELLTAPAGSVAVKVGEYVRCRDSKRGRNRPANLCPSWRELLEAVGVDRLANPPERLRTAALPWDDKPTTEQQQEAERELGAVSGYLLRTLSERKGMKADRELIGLRTLRHNAARRLLEVKRDGRPALELWRIAGLLSTSETQLRLTYSDHARFRTNETIAEVFG